MIHSLWLQGDITKGVSEPGSNSGDVAMYSCSERLTMIANKIKVKKHDKPKYNGIFFGSIKDQCYYDFAELLEKMYDKIVEIDKRTNNDNTSSK